MINKLFGLVFFGIILISLPTASFAQEKSYPVRLFLFHSESCPHCKDELEFLKELRKDYPNLELRDYEVSGFKEQAVFSKVVDRYKLSGGVPVTVIGDQHFMGFDDKKGVGKEIEGKVKECSKNGCNSWLDELLGLEKNTTTEAVTETVTTDSNKPKKISFLGQEIAVDGQSSVFGSGLILGLIDGVNPCMFSVLVFLLTYLMAIGSRKRAIKAGIIFIVVTFLVYFLFMLGIFKIISFLSVIAWARYLIIAFAAFAGLVMIKDFFYYGKWFSLEIPKKYKPKIEELIKRGTVASTIVLALLSSLVELPCTSAIPVLYLTFLADKELSPFWPLVIYNLAFILPLIVIVLMVGFVWAKVEQVEQFRLKGRKYMRLMAGIVLLTLALALWQNWI